MELNGKKAIVTGGVRGIGYAIVKQLIGEGALVGVFDINSEGLNEIQDEYKDIRTYQCDLTEPQQVEDCINRFFAECGEINILINNAGLLFNSPLVQFSAEGIRKHDIKAWDKAISINLSSLFYMAVNVAEKMLFKRTKGVIANISSVCACGNRGQSAYSAAKAGVNALTATWAKELGVMGIRVVGIAPGYTDTESTHQVLNEEVLKDIKRDIPLRRLGKAEEIAEGVVSVIRNDFFNGKVFEIDGGLVL
ncbi:SDR family NAD(P)-dependent oxidoreductase [Fibrobacterota bacterium]